MCKVLVTKGFIFMCLLLLEWMSATWWGIARGNVRAEFPFGNVLTT